MNLFLLPDYNDFFGMLGVILPTSLVAVSLMLKRSRRSADPSIGETGDRLANTTGFIANANIAAALKSTRHTGRTLHKLKKLFSRIRRILTEDFPIYLRAADKKPVSIQVTEIFELFRLYRYIPYQYIKHGLYRRKFRREIVRYIPTELLHMTRDAANVRGNRFIVQDKLQFEDLLSEAGIKTTRTLFLLTRNEILDRSGGTVDFGRFLAAVEAMDLPRGIIVKPRAGGSGSAIFKMNVSGGNLVHDAMRLDQRSFLNLVFTTNNGTFWDQFLIQETIAQHPQLDLFNMSSANSVRIDTFMEESGEIRFNAAALKVGAPGSITDNVTSGGSTIAIDLETGRLTSGAKVDARYGGHYFDLKSRFGIDSRDFVMPHWPQVLALTRRAAECLAPFRSLGWDIAISKDGPLVIETNFDYGIDVLQEMTGGYIDTPLGNAYLNRHAADKAAILKALSR